MEHKLKSKYMVVQVRENVVLIDAYEDRTNHSGSPYSGGYTHLLEDGEVEITSEDITIKGIEYFRRWLSDCKEEHADAYEYTESDVQDRTIQKLEKPQGILRRFKKVIDKSYREPYLITATYTMKKRKDFSMVSNCRWVMRFSNGEVLSSEIA